MCGISGEVGFGRRPVAADVGLLTERIRHRGPDDGGLWVSTDEKCVLGHRRLSIIDLSPLGRQPMIDPETGNAIVFNGEIYNFRALRTECEGLGDAFRSASDTEVILALYRRWGPDCVARMRGMFALAIWDQAGQSLFLARDRVGKKPLNYAVTEHGIVFCSEIYPLSRHPAVDKTTDLAALELYLQLQYIPAPLSIYKGIRKLPPAHYAIYDKDGIRLSKYWEVDYRNKVDISDLDALAALDERLTEAVRLRMVSDVPIGALLSGGVDSSVVVALMSKIGNQKVRTYSIGFSEESFNELPFAQEVADRFDTVHLPRLVSGDVEALLPVIAAHYGEPFADSSAIPSFHVSRLAREHVSVVLTGDGGDELLAGYPRYKQKPLARLTTSLTRECLDGQALARLGGYLAGNSTSKRIARQILGNYGWPETSFVSMYSSFWNDEQRSELLGQLHAPGVLRSWRSGWLEGAVAHATDPTDRLLWIDNRTYLPGDLLTKMDIASMHVGLEARSPFLDHEVIEFAASLSGRHKVRGNVGKYLLKSLATQFFPESFIHRQKMGFGIPLAEWLRGPLREVVHETLSNGRLMEPLDLRCIQRTLTSFDEGDASTASRVWSLLMLGQWRALEAT